MFIEITFRNGLLKQSINNVLSISKILDKLQVDTSTFVYQFPYKEVLDIYVFMAKVSFETTEQNEIPYIREEKKQWQF